ncbi:hypothetical protein CEXT_115721 [Caerostris extrusa]|uniref:Uncharacterized protein n=1 Tax=Caerostris extrusa TaxID=172846 RepID=A0AAV4RY63_CAEEX|nr:hypothetical protein CEXT_115721 [Caerostris extrusa]
MHITKSMPELKEKNEVLSSTLLTFLLQQNSPEVQEREFVAIAPGTPSPELQGSLSRKFCKIWWTDISARAPNRFRLDYNNGCFAIQA